MRLRLGFDVFLEVNASDTYIAEAVFEDAVRKCGSDALFKGFCMYTVARGFLEVDCGVGGGWVVTFRRVGGEVRVHHELQCRGRSLTRDVSVSLRDFERILEAITIITSNEYVPSLGQAGPGPDFLPMRLVPADETVSEVLGVEEVPAAVNALFRYVGLEEYRSPLSLVLGFVDSLADFAIVFIGLPGSGKTTLAYWLAYTALLKLLKKANDVLGLGIDPLSIDLHAVLRALHPTSLEDLVTLMNYGERCRRLPLLFLDDAIPTWWSINASRLGRQFYSKFMSFFRNWAGMVFITTQYNNAFKAMRGLPRYYVMHNAPQKVIEVSWYRRLIRTVRTAVGPTNAVGKYAVYRVAIPYDPGGPFRLPPDFEEDTAAAKANFRRVYRAGELDTILSKDETNCEDSRLSREPVGDVITIYNNLMRKIRK